MVKEEAKRLRIIGLRLTVGEFDTLEKRWKKTTCRKLSEYVRRLLFGKPVVSNYRNASLDEVMAELMRLRRELNAMGNNFNQAVHKLHTLDHVPQMRSWLAAWEQDKNLFFGKLDEVTGVISRLGKQWLQ